MKPPLSIPDHLRVSREDRPLHEVPDGFAEEVLRKIRLQDRQRAASPPNRNAVVWFRLLAAGAAVSLLTFLLWNDFVRRPAQPSPELAANATLDVTLPPIRTDLLAELPARLDEPLEKELQLLISDTRNAVNFLAANFTPQPAP